MFGKILGYALLLPVFGIAGIAIGAMVGIPPQIAGLVGGVVGLVLLSS